MSMFKGEAAQLIIDCRLDIFDAVVDVSPIGPQPLGGPAWDVWIRGEHPRDRNLQVTNSEEHLGRYLVGIDERDDLHKGNVGFTVEVGKADIHQTILLLMHGVFVFS